MEKFWGKRKKINGNDDDNLNDDDLYILDVEKNTIENQNIQEEDVVNENQNIKADVVNKNQNVNKDNSQIEDNIFEQRITEPVAENNNVLDNEPKNKPNLFDKAISQITNLKETSVNIGNKIVAKVETGIEEIGQKKKSLENNDDDLVTKILNLTKEIEEIKETAKQSTPLKENFKTNIVLSENLSISDLIIQMEQSNSFMKQIAIYLRHEVENIIELFIEEQLTPITQKIKQIKLEELQLQNKYNILMQDLDIKLNGKQNEIMNVEKEIVVKKQNFQELVDKIENEEKTLENITVETNIQNQALLSLIKSVEAEKKRFTGDLETFKEDSKNKIEEEINELKIKVNNELNEEIEMQVLQKLEDFEKIFVGLSKDLKNKILEKLLNK